MVRNLSREKVLQSAWGAAVTTLCGLLLWALAQGCTNASYDNLFRFGNRGVTNQVALILMNNAAYTALGQTRDQPWDRALHAQLLNRLADDGCPLVVFDIFFGSERTAEGDQALTEAIQKVREKQGKVILMAQTADPQYPGLDIAEIKLPHKKFLAAAAGWGIGHTSALEGQTARRHWPFPAPAPGNFRSLPWVAAQVAGASLNQSPKEQWLRYYGESGGWTTFSYHLALSSAPGYFRDKVVFIGNQPLNDDPTFEEQDKFCTPYTRWTGKAVGGVEIMATTFFNLTNGDWLRRFDPGIEVLLLIGTGALFGGGLCRLRVWVALAVSAGAALTVTAGVLIFYHLSNLWFPWLVVVGGQVPCALGWALVPSIKQLLLPRPESGIPDYELFEPPFGEGAFGKVWVARSAIGQWQALKKVDRNAFLKKCNHDRPYHMEFEGISKYKPISELHPGLLRIELVSKQKPEGYFYYVMELADAQVSDWAQNPALYKPWTLETLRQHAEKSRLPVRDCVTIMIALCETLDFLHRRNLTHRDIKPSNVIFVKGVPKLADVGLVTEARMPEQAATDAGTPGFMPPYPEPNGTVQADIHALGMTLYVISTGSPPAFFPELSSTLMGPIDDTEFVRLNPIILKACHPDRTQRYQSATEMLESLRRMQETFDTASKKGATEHV